MKRELAILGMQGSEQENINTEPDFKRFNQILKSAKYWRLSCRYNGYYTNFD